MSSSDAMTSPAAATRPAGDPSPRRLRSPVAAASPPSPPTTAERTGATVAAEFGIATPEKQHKSKVVSDPGTLTRDPPLEGETVAMLMRAHVVPCKGVDEDEYVMNTVVNDLAWLVYTAMIIKGDNERALQFFAP